MSDIIVSGDGNLALRGDLTYATVRRLFADTPVFADTVTVDLQAVAGVDSAGLALLVHWDNVAAANAAELRFTGAPTQLKQMAKISGLESLF